MENYIFNIDIITIIKNTLTTEGICPTYITPLPGKTIEPKYKIDSYNGTFFAKISGAKRFDESFNRLLRRNNEICLPPIISKEIPQIDRQLNVYVWVDGKDLKTIMNNADECECYEYGIRCGSLLKSLHSISPEGIPSCFNVDERIESLLRFLVSNECKLKHKSFWYNYLCKNINTLKQHSNKSIVHFDFKPKNIMLSNDRLLIVDFDSCSIADPWFDFYDKALGVYFGRQVFNKGIIDGYFNKDIPFEFWEFFKVLSVYGLIQSAYWSANRTNTNYIYEAECYLLESYNNFTEQIPIWYT